jgi:predicted transposase YdaD
MSQRFDATLKQLVQAHPRDWLAALHGPVEEPVEVLSPDLSTVSRFADTVLRVGDRGIFHIDFQSGPDPALPRRMLLYNVLLHEAYALPVHTAVVLLRPRAGGAGMRGTVTYQLVPRRGRLQFRFEVVRVWQRPAEEWLSGGMGLVPLALLGRLPAGMRPPAGLRSIVARLKDRLTREVSGEAAELLNAAYILAGLRVSREEGIRLFRGVQGMHESTTYQAILDEGREDGIRKTLLRQGRLKFGPPDANIETEVQAITDLARLERMSERLLNASTWKDVLATR